MKKRSIDIVSTMKVVSNTFTKTRAVYIVFALLLLSGAWVWLSHQRAHIALLEKQKQYEQDIENIYHPIDDISLSMIKRISDQEIRTDEKIDEKGQNDYIQFKYSYMQADDIRRKINLTKQYSIVIQKQLEKWQEDEIACDFHVCKQYAQYINQLNIKRDLYQASKKNIESEFSSDFLKRLPSEAFNL